MVVLHVADEGVRYPKTVEQHLFLMVQQAVENPFAHAEADTVHIRGHLDPESAHLVVEDDGRGFPDHQPLDLTGLVANQPFGLASMVERSALIGADLTLASTPGKGTRVTLSWPAPGDGHAGGSLGSRS